MEKINKNQSAPAIFYKTKSRAEMKKLETNTTITISVNFLFRFLFKDASFNSIGPTALTLTAAVGASSGPSL